MTSAIGLDFGTTNTVITAVTADGNTEALSFPYNGELLNTFRSVICFLDQDGTIPEDQVVEAGPYGIDHYIANSQESRFIQSFKTFAASASFVDTRINRARYTFEDLLVVFLTKAFSHGRMSTSFQIPKRVLIGRPVKFAGSHPKDAVATERYNNALKTLGFEEIYHVYEPVAAAFYYAQRLKKDAVVLVADFGGGTSDFSLVRFSKKDSGIGFETLAHTGIGKAGDTFDHRIIENMVAPLFGLGSTYRSWGKNLEIPTSYYTAFSQWNQLSLLAKSKSLRELKEFAIHANEPAKLNRFVEFLENNSGYPLYQSVAATKFQLSHHEQSSLKFSSGSIHIDSPVKRSDFESWIEEDLSDIGDTVDAAINSAGLSCSDVDKVFLTGGSSFVPAVRALFSKRFEQSKIETGDELVSISHGLGLIAAQDDLSQWVVET